MRVQRLVFGEVAELYDRRRPTYPEDLIDDVIALSGLDAGGRALEVGAGTGKATVLMAARGVKVLAVEPNHDMAQVARRNCAAYPAVEFVEADFERSQPEPAAFRLLYSAQAWHWVNPETRYGLARAALAEGGLLAVFWNRIDWRRSPVRDRLARVYAETAPEFEIHTPNHPGNLHPDQDEDWEAEIAQEPAFAEPEVRSYEWSVEQTGSEYVELLSTQSDIRLLSEDRRASLLSALEAAIDGLGGTLTLPLFTSLCLARAV
jgi:SAM-dependent methyltransferase